MSVNTRELRRRIRGTKSIKQITKAMEMIAASKMRRAQLAALSSRPYANAALEILASLSAARAETTAPVRPAPEDEGETLHHDLLSPGNPTAPPLIVVITPNRGLCGSLPAQLIAAAIRAGGEGGQYIAVGRKAQRALARLGRNILAAFDGFETHPASQETNPIARIGIEAFSNQTVSSVSLIYADFVSTLQYRIRIHRLLPLSHEAWGGTAPPNAIEFLFEPSPAEVLSSLLPRLIELQVYQAVLEGLASEHSARMVMMQNAAKTADDLINDFTLTYHAARQAAITAELADITGGRFALSR